RQIADDSGTLKVNFWRQSLGGLVDSDAHDEIIVGHQSQNIEQLLCTLQLLINAPSASGLRMIPPLEFSTLVQLLPPQFKAPITSMVLGKVQSSSECGKLLRILDAVCTTTTMTRA